MIVSNTLLGLLLAAIVLSAAHKVYVIADGGASAIPVIQSKPWRRSHATLLVGAAVIVELTDAVLLASRPILGIYLAIAVLGAYSYALLALQRSDDCGCFGSAVATPRNRALLRNAVLVFALASVAAMYALGLLALESPRAWTVGASFVVVGIAGALTVTRHLIQSIPVVVPETSIQWGGQR